MLTPTTREVNLLTVSHSFRRGCVQLSGSIVPEQHDAGDSNEQDMSMWSPAECRVVEEDCCLLPPIPTALRLLPSVLLGTRAVPTTPHLNHDVLCSRLAKTSNTSFEVMCILYGLEALSKFSCKGRSLHLDYLPILRTTAAFERAALTISDIDDCTSSRRRTRKSAKNGRCHYFEALNPSYPWGEDNCHKAEEIGERLAFRLKM